VFTPTTEKITKCYNNQLLREGLMAVAWRKAGRGRARAGGSRAAAVEHQGDRYVHTHIGSRLWRERLLRVLASDEAMLHVPLHWSLEEPQQGGWQLISTDARRQALQDRARAAAESGVGAIDLTDD
jgi:hypothetical protein